MYVVIIAITVVIIIWVTVTLIYFTRKSRNDKPITEHKQSETKNFAVSVKFNETNTISYQELFDLVLQTTEGNGLVQKAVNTQEQKADWQNQSRVGEENKTKTNPLLSIKDVNFSTLINVSSLTNKNQ